MTWSEDASAPWDREGAALGPAAAVRPALVRLPGATGILWVRSGGIAFRLHEDGDPPAMWMPAETAGTGATTPLVSLDAAVAPEGSVLAVAATADGEASLVTRDPTGVWMREPLAGQTFSPAIVVDGERRRAHLFHLVERSGRCLLHHRESSLEMRVFGDGRFAAGWPGVGLQRVFVPRALPSLAPDVVAVATGSDARGYFARVALPGEADRNAPITLQHEPPPGVAVELPASLSFRITDDRAGVDRATLRLFVNGVEVAPRIRGGPRNLLVSHELGPELGPAVGIRIEATDLAATPRVMHPFEYELTAGAEKGSRFRRGDGNADGAIDISDALLVLIDLFLNPAPVGCLDGEDANDDGAVNLTDAVFILDYLFVGGPAPPAPGGECGFDSTPDALECAGATGCS